MGSTARAADDGELLEAQLVRDCRDVAGRISHRAPGLRVGPAVAGPVVDDHSRAVALVEAWVRMAGEAAAGGPVRDEDRDAALGAALDECQCAPVGRAGCPLPFHAADHTDGPEARCKKRGPAS